MKTNTIKNLFFWIFLLFSGSLSAIPSEAEFRKLAETWTLHQDGSQEYRYYKELTLFTHTAMNSTYGQTFITYNPDFQELKIHSAYVKQKDGTTIQTPDNAFVEVLPAGAADAPAYNRLKEMVIVHTGLELGATIYLDYSVISKAGYLPAIDVCKPLEESSIQPDLQFTGLRYSALCPSSAKSATPKIATTRQAATEMDIPQSTGPIERTGYRFTER